MATIVGQEFNSIKRNTVLMRFKKFKSKENAVASFSQSRLQTQKI